MSDGILKYGGGGNLPGVRNFAGASLNGLSLCCTPIELLANDGSDYVIGTATGFFWKNDQPYLITNWHVVSGRNSLTGKLNEKGFIPRKMRFYNFSISTEAGSIGFSRYPCTIVADDDGVELLSKQPHHEGEALDIWGIPYRQAWFSKRMQTGPVSKGLQLLRAF